MLPGKIRKFVLAIRRIAGKLHPHIPIGIIRGMTTVVQTASLVFALGTWLVETSLTSRSMEREGKGRGGGEIKSNSPSIILAGTGADTGTPTRKGGGSLTSTKSLSVGGG